MHCFGFFLVFLWCCFQYIVAVPLGFLPPPLLVTCSNPQHHVYQRQDNELQVSCLWDGNIELKYSRAPGLAPEIKREKSDVQPPPHCQWYQDSILINKTNNWSGQLVLGTSKASGSSRSPLDLSRITVQCVSASCHVPTCAHNNLSIEISGQDIHLFLLSPHMLPIHEWQPVQLGWCARLKSSTWSYRFRSQGGSPADLLIPSNQHSEPPIQTAYPHAEFHQMCASYYSYYMTVRYPQRGFYTALLHIENGPQLNRSLSFYVQPALLHVFSGSSRLLSLPHRTLSLSWTLQSLSSRIMAYTLVDVQGLEEWYHNYNPFALKSDFCAVPTSHSSKAKVITSIYFRTNKRMSGELTGKLAFSNSTLSFTTNSAIPTHLTPNPQKTKGGTYVFSPTLGLYYSVHEGSAVNATGESSSSHYVFYQQQSLSYLIVVQFVQLQWYRFSVHVYLNRRGILFRTLGDKGLEVHHFNGHSPDESWVYIVWFIPVQHPLLQCEWSFSLELFDSKKEYLLWNNTYTYKDHVRNAAHFIPNSVLPFKPALYTGFVAEVNCRKTGLAHAVLRTTVNTYASKVMEPKVTCQKSYCHALTVLIHKPNSSDPVISYRTQSEITLQSTAKAVCRSQSEIYILWNIYRLHTIWNPPDWFNPLKVPGDIRTGGVTFHIPARYLVPGFYLVNMTMTVHLLAYDIKVRKFDSVFLQIMESNLVANIAGGYFRTVGISDRWALDGSASFDPDSANPHEELQFNWYCSKQEMEYITMHRSPREKCHPNQSNVYWSLSNNTVQIVEPNTLQENTKYYIILMIQKKAKTAHTYQIVHVLPGSVPALNIICFENCGKAIKATVSLVLFAKCLNCEKVHQTSYLWTLLSANSNEIYFDWDSKTTTGRSSPSIHINPLAFGYKPDKFYSLSLKVSTQGKQPAVSKYSFYVNAPPQIGKCIIYPRVGTAFLTKFTIQCNEFEDKKGPLTYKVIAASDLMKTAKISSLQKNTFGTIVYIGYHHRTPLSFLPIGIPAKMYALTIYVQVHDSDGVFSQIMLQATVHPPGKSKASNIVLNKLYGLISGPNAPISVFLKTKDYFNIGYFVHMVASVLNNIETSPAIHSSKTDLREILLNMSAEIPMTEVDLVNQVVSSICQVTQEVSEVNSESQLLAVKKLKEASEALKTHRSKDLGSKEAEILGSGILTGLSNVLRASLLNHGSVNMNAIKETISVTEILADLVLQGKVPGEYETNMKAEGWSIYLWKHEKWDVSQTFSKRRNCKNCFYPKLNQEDHTDLLADAMVSTILYVFDENPFPWLADTTDIRTVVTGFKMAGSKADGDTIGITPKVTEVIMARKDENSATFGLTIGPDKKFYRTTGGFSFEVKRSSRDIFIQILCNMEVVFNVSIYLGLDVSQTPIASYIAFYDKPPVLSDTHSNITDCTIKAPYILCLPQSLLWFPLQGSRADKWNISIVLQSHPIVRVRTTKIVRIAVFTADCLELDGVQSQWKGGTCSLGPQTSWSKIHCICKAKEHSMRRASPPLTGTSRPGVKFLAGKVTLYPNPLDIQKILLAEFDSIPVTLLSVGFIFAGYIFCIIWAMIKDKADLKRKHKIFVLPDNDPFHNVCYIVTVYTGSRLGSGTSADVFIELIGQNGISDAHHLMHPEFPTLFRAAVDTFLLTTSNDLGDICSLRIWHNNRGSSPSWYLSRIKVQNVHTKQSWLFICRKWFSLEKEDSKIERTFDATSPDSRLKKTDYYLIKLAKDLEDTHLWLSIFGKVVSGSFNRVQRASCCLAALLSTQLFNIMFFLNKDERVVVSIQLRFWKSIYVGFLSSLVSIPVQMTTTVLFTYSQEKPLLPNTYQSVPEEILSETLGGKGNSQSSKNVSSYAAHKNTDVQTTRQSSNPEFFFFVKMPDFPWWCRYIAWMLIFLMSGISAFFIILYGLTYGYTTSLEWLIASILSFCQSVFLLQTLKMAFISAVSAITLKHCENISWISTEQYQEMKLVQVKNMDATQMIQMHHDLVRHRNTKKYQPLLEDEVIILRRSLKAQQLAFVFVKDLVCHLAFSACIFIIIYKTEPTTSFYYNQAIYNKFSPGLSKVNKLEHIYIWMSNVYVPLIHNDYQPTYLSDTWSKILGLPRMRQIRADNTEKACFPPLSFVNNFVIGKSHCRHEYKIDPEDQTDYLGSWTIPTSKSVSSHASNFQGFTYQSDIDKWEYKSYGVLNTYGPGGYTFYFFPGEQRPNTTMRLDDLQRNNWLDERTWAVIFELTTFNPDVDMYCSITVMFETSDVGVVNASLSVHSYKLTVVYYEINSQTVLYGITVCMLVFFLVDEFHKLYKEGIGYLKSATNLNNFAIITISLFYIVLVIWKFKLSYFLLESYLLNPEEFVPFHAASQMDQLFRIVAGFLAFFLILKSYCFFRFIHNVRLAEKTLSAALPGFVYMSVLVVLFFFVCMSFGYLVFGQYEWDYKSLLNSLQTVVSYCFVSHKQTGLSSNRWLLIFFQALFFCVMIFVFINLWRALIISTYESMKQPVYEQYSDEAEATNFIFLKIQSIWCFITGRTRATNDNNFVSNIFMGKSVRGNDQQQGIKTRQVNGKQIVYLAVCES
ncbi:polycystin family receptor for egg jelly-like [Hemicordylus capensis]|uniref:polycystin family receptor for egg jelly-like n=1 Tax=Hemicordylus capensis TaxID=884348 RepID=UPI0023028359|nr:polycystin family receptor for egg jelly-like [Hemicordylus capensis]